MRRRGLAGQMPAQPKEIKKRNEERRASKKEGTNLSNMRQELIIGLVNHRKLGRLFQAYLISKQENYYQVDRLVRLRDLSNFSFTAEEKELITLTEKLSDEELTKRFSKRMEPTNFLNQLDPNYFKEHINPFIDRQLSSIITILMRGNTRLFSKDDKYSNLYEEDCLKVHGKYLDCRLCFQRHESGISYQLQLFCDDKFFPILYRKPQFLVMKPASFVLNGELYVLENLESSKIVPFLGKKELLIPRSAEHKYLETFVKQSIANHRVKVSGFKLVKWEDDPEMILELNEDLSGNLILIPKFNYGGKIFLPHDTQKVHVEMRQEDESYFFSRIVRRKQWESSCLEQLKLWGLEESYQMFVVPGCGLLSNHSNNLHLFDWLDEHEHLFRTHQMSYQKSKGLPNYSRDKGEMELHVSEKDDWFDVHAVVRFGKYEIPFIKLKDHIRLGKHQLELPNGEIAILPEEWFVTYRDLLSVGIEDADHLLIKKHYHSLLDRSQISTNKEILSRLNSLQGEGSLVAVPSGLQAELRSYQHEGYSWLYHLYSNKFGGCLADDMGLGKTLQTISLLQKLKRQKLQFPTLVSSNERNLFSEIESINAHQQQNQTCSLVVMPTSLLHNWRHELEKFAPDLKVCTYYGAQRKKNKIAQLSNLYDVILTSYGTVRNDVEKLCDFSFFYIILDESQNIKNPESKIYQSIIKLKGQNRLVLTGTPIENSLSDLWAQMNFINPGLLGNFNYFKREYILPIERKNSEEQQAKLQLLIRPFILRRSKHDVAKDLPALTEQIRYCPMADAQHSMYEREKSAIRNALIQKIETDGMSKSAIQILQGLSRLRQLANHPDMIGMESDRESDSESGKFNAVIESLQLILEEKHKVLIFSSFVKHLNILKSHLEEEKIRYSMLTGSTRNREEVINSFQEDEDNRVFLISLKAGGVGLNLTQADYVFILDPWWNPAAEMQAISRAHRIGQEKKVMVYRFITEGSIEEKIISMQERKSNLAEQFINTSTPFQNISQEELLSLF